MANKAKHSAQALIREHACPGLVVRFKYDVSQLKPVTAATFALRSALFVAIIGLNLFYTDRLIFEDDINGVGAGYFETEKQDRLIDLQKEYSLDLNRLDNIDRRFQRLESGLDLRDSLLTVESNGDAASGVSGHGENYNRKLADLNRYKAEVYAPFMASYEAKRATAKGALSAYYQRREEIKTEKFEPASISTAQSFAYLWELMWRPTHGVVWLFMLSIICLALVIDFTVIAMRGKVVEIEEYLKYYHRNRKELEATATADAAETRVIAAARERGYAYSYNVRAANAKAAQLIEATNKQLSHLTSLSQKEQMLENINDRYQQRARNILDDAARQFDEIYQNMPTPATTVS